MVTDTSFVDQCLVANESRGGIQQEIPHLRRFARVLAASSTDADDLVQDCLERALTRFHQFQPGTDLRAWLFTLLKNIHIDRQRKQLRRGHHVELEDHDHEFAQPPAQEPSIEFREFCRAFLCLKADHREVLIRVGVEGQSYEEVADALNIAVGTVKSRLCRARERLRELCLNGVFEPPVA